MTSVGFEHKDVGGANALEHQARCVAQVGQETQVSGRGTQEVADGVLGVMGDAERFDPDVADLESRAGREYAAIQASLECNSMASRVGRLQ